MTYFLYKKIYFSQFVFHNVVGQFNVSLIDVLAKWTIKGKLQKINGEDFMVVNSFDVLPEPKEVKISATGLFPDEELSEWQLI